MPYADTYINFGGKKYKGYLGTGYSLAPIRDIAEASGARVEWKDNAPWINGRKVDNFTMIGDKSYMRSRDLAGLLGADVSWDDKTRQVGMNIPTGSLLNNTLGSLAKYTPRQYQEKDPSYWLSQAKQVTDPLYKQGAQDISNTMEFNMARRNVNPNSTIVQKQEQNELTRLQTALASQAAQLAQDLRNQDYSRFLSEEEQAARAIESQNAPILARIQYLQQLLNQEQEDKARQLTWAREDAQRAAELALEREKLNANNKIDWYNAQTSRMAAMSRGSGGGGASGTPNVTDSQAKRMANQSFVDLLTNYYKKMLAKSKTPAKSSNLPKGGKLGDVVANKSVYNAAYPLYDTLNYLFTDPALTQQILLSGANKKDIADALITSVYKKSPTEYFATPKGSQLKKLYESLYTNPVNDISLLFP